MARDARVGAKLTRSRPAEKGPAAGNQGGQVSVGRALRGKGARGKGL